MEGYAMKCTEDYAIKKKKNKALVQLVKKQG